MKVFFIVLFFCGSVSAFSNDNNPYYLKMDKVDVQFAIIDIPDRETVYCDIMVEEEQGPEKPYARASFNCNSSSFKKNRKISWEGVSATLFVNFIKKHLESSLKYQVLIDETKNKKKQHLVLKLIKDEVQLF